MDDEPLARARIRQLLDDEPDIVVAAECSDGFEALRILERRSVDAMFLDVQMPELDGFGVLDSLEPGRAPAVVFVTAYDTFAVKAFQVHAVDYVLKPIDRVLFAQAVERMRTELQHRRSDKIEQNLLGLIREMREVRHSQDRFVISRAGRYMFLQVSDVDYVTTEGNYVKVHSKGEDHLLRSTMKNIEDRLDPNRFVRIHRSTLVNVERLKELQPYRKDDSIAILKDGTRLTVSRRYRKTLLDTVTMIR